MLLYESRDHHEVSQPFLLAVHYILSADNIDSGAQHIFVQLVHLMRHSDSAESLFTHIEVTTKS